MPQTLDKTFHGQIIGGTFSSHENADKAVEAFKKLGILDNNIQVIVQLNGAQPKAVYTDMLTERGFADSQARYYDKAIRDGKTLVVVHDAINPAEVIDVFDGFGAEFNPNGSRNLRQDVLGMTTGAAVGAVALGAVGGVAAGPAGAVAGAAAGVVVGGGTGAAVGKAVEHKK